MYDKLSVLIDVLAEEAAATSAEKSATVYADSSKADRKPFVLQVDHIAKCKLELATKAQNLQKSLKLIIFQVEQGKVARVVVTEVGERKSSEDGLLVSLTPGLLSDSATKSCLDSAFILHTKSIFRLLI